VIIMAVIGLMALLIILALGAAAGALLTKLYQAHARAELQAEEDALAEVQELYAARARMRAHPPPGGQGPSALDHRDWLPV
jgi:hypothetical protein